MPACEISCWRIVLDFFFVFEWNFFSNFFFYLVNQFVWLDNNYYWHSVIINQSSWARTKVHVCVLYYVVDRLARERRLKIRFFGGINFLNWGELRLKQTKKKDKWIINKQWSVPRNYYWAQKDFLDCLAVHQNWSKRLVLIELNSNALIKMTWKNNISPFSSST